MFTAKPRRLAGYFAASLVPCAVWIALLAGAGPGYRPDRPPGPLEFCLSVWAYLLVPAIYGLFAIVPLRRGSPRAGRWFLVGAVAVGAAATTVALWFDLTFSGIDCRPDDCVAAVPVSGYFYAVYATSLLPAVVGPLLLATVGWPRPEPGR